MSSEGLQAATDRLVRSGDPAAVLQAVYTVMLAAKRSDSVRLDPSLSWAEPIVEHTGGSTRKLRRYVADIITLRQAAGEVDGMPALRELRRGMYQAALMTDRRDRLNKAVKIYQLQGHAVSGNQIRAVLAQRQQAAWRAQREEYLAQCAAAAGRKLGWYDRLSAIERFWDAIDDALDAQLKELERGPA